MNLLLDFINTKSWTIDRLLDFHKTHGLYSTVHGQELGYETKLVSESHQGCIFWFKEDEVSLKMAAATDLSVLPGDPRYQELFAYLLRMRDLWIDSIKNTITDGPNISFLNSIANRSRFQVNEGASPWAVEVGNFWTEDSTFEVYLEADYLRVFLTGKGDLLKKLKICQNEDCSKWFVFNRPKQIYCCDKCRLAYHNSKNSKDENIRKARAENVRKGRAEGKYQ
ncbi:MAG: hypothetical protein H8E17_12860 [Deltaproteobacteria bacterium]|nr:hypothetical protein [Deltaproteobacteria bacterium]